MCISVQICLDAILCFFLQQYVYFKYNRIDDVMVSVLVSRVVDRGFEPRSGQTKDYKIELVFVASPLSMQH